VTVRNPGLLFATVPTVGAVEGEVTGPGATGTPRFTVLGWFSKAEAKVKLKHGLATENLINVTALKLSAKKPSVSFAVKEWKPEGTTEVEVIFSAAPAAKEEIAVIVWAA
jgi:hypothetical protein